MSRDELIDRLTRDLESIQLPVNEVDLHIRPFSKTYFGRYYPSVDESVRPRIFIYPYRNKQGGMYPYSQVLDTAIHEMVHHLQHTNSSFVRVKGVMHDPNFWKLYSRYTLKAEKIGGEAVV